LKSKENPTKIYRINSFNEKWRTSMGKFNLFHLPLKVLFVFTLIISLLPVNTSFGSTGTTVPGVISTNTTWTKQGSPYILPGGAIINPNVTLTIEPGVEVIGPYGKMIDVQGKLKAIGTPEERIILRDIYVNGWDWSNQSIHLEYTNLFHESFKGGLLITSSNRDVILRHNRFSNGSVKITPKYSDVYIENNFFTNDSTLNITNGKTKVYVRDNTFKNVGNSEADVSIISRDPDGNLPNVELNRNNFLGQFKLGVKLDGFNSIVFNGLNNYWGTTSLVNIDNKILESNNKLNIETIAYKPFNNGFEYGLLESPIVHSVGDNAPFVRGLTDTDSKVSIYNGSELIGQGWSAFNGEFNIGIPLQIAGAKLNVSVLDSYGRTNNNITVTVQDQTVPIAPVVNEISDLTTNVTGMAEPGSSIFIKKGTEIIGSTVVSSDGKFEVLIEQQAVGSVLTVYSKDAVGHTSGSVSMMVLDRNPPLKPILTTVDVTDRTSVISGNAEKGNHIFIEVISKSRNEVVSGMVNSDGTFSITIPIPKAGSNLKITAKDVAGNPSESVLVPVRDVTPPVIRHISPLTDQSKTVNGLSEPGSVISLKLNGTEIGSTIANSDGTFLMEIVPQQFGTELEMTATDATGNVSEVHRMTIGKISTFTDLKSNHRFYEEINYLLGREVITGYQDGTFRPSDTVTRAQAAIMIGRALGLNGEKRDSGFKDVGISSAASGYISSAVERGIITGFNDDTYRPNAPVTRAQMAIFIARAFNLKEEAKVSFTDVPKGSASYVYIQRILAAGITTGYAGGIYKPEGKLIRSDFSAFMARALDDQFKIAVK
jgi:hypothetical protein